MAAGLTEIFLTNGQKISVYTNASPLQVPVHCSMTGTAVAGSPIDFSVQNDCFIKDIVVTTTTAGELEVTRNHMRTGRKITTDQRYLISQDRKPFIPKLGFRAGQIYNLVPTVVTS